MRLTTISAPHDSIMVKGFNNTSSSVAGFTDSRPELYVPGMPEDLVLLCAADYTTSGATILLPNEGYVLSLSPVLIDAIEVTIERCEEVHEDEEFLAAGSTGECGAVIVVVFSIYHQSYLSNELSFLHFFFIHRDHVTQKWRHNALCQRCG